MPAIPRERRLCHRHSKGGVPEEHEGVVRGLREPDDYGPRLPTGHALCPVCAAKEAQTIAARESGTYAVTRVSTDSSEEQYLEGVSNPRAREILAERRRLEITQAHAEERALAILDEQHDFAMQYDHAGSKAEQVDLLRKRTGQPSIRDLRRAAHRGTLGERWTG
jgi:hypothetical protein